MKENFYWKSFNLNHLVERLSKDERKDVIPLLNNIKKTYKELSEKYQSHKEENKIPLK